MQWFNYLIHQFQSAEVIFCRLKERKCLQRDVTAYRKAGGTISLLCRRWTLYLLKNISRHFFFTERLYKYQPYDLLYFTDSFTGRLKSLSRDNGNCYELLLQCETRLQQHRNYLLGTQFYIMNINDVIVFELKMVNLSLEHQSGYTKYPADSIA